MKDKAYIEQVNKTAQLYLRLGELKQYLKEEDPLFPIRIATEAQIKSLERRIEYQYEKLATLAVACKVNKLPVIPSISSKWKQ